LAVAIWNISTSSTDLVLVPWLAINHPTSIVGTPVSGTLTGNITWTLANSPYVVVGNTTLAKGATLTIEPGVEVRVRGGLSVAIKGTFSAIGTQQQHITFDRDGTSNWGEILVDYDGDGTIRPATMKYCDIRHVSTGVHVLGTGQSPVLVEDCAIDLWTSLAVKWDQDGGLGCNNLIFRRCRFGMDSGGPLPCEAINGYHSHAIVEYCTFAPQGGYSDAVDLANSRWADGNWPICRYNVLLGGQDDGIDYDDSDGIIEGTIIMNRFPSGYAPPAVPDSAHYPPPGNGPNGGGTTGNEGSSPVILNNVIYHCYYGIGYKNGAQPTILNNTIIDCTWGVVVYSANDIPNPGPAHAILRNNILWNCGDPIRRRWYDTDGIISTVDVAYCAIDAKEEGWLYDDVEQGWVWAGEGNVALTANPLGDYGHDDYGPQPGSPVIDAGYAGLVPYEAGQWPVPSTDCLGHAREDDPSMPNTGVGTPPYVDLGAVEYLYPMPADVIPDRCVNVADLLRVRNDMGKASNPGDPLATDVNRDGVVNVADLLIVRNSLGKGSGC
jgi:parallel beta-helix repeat protein